MNMKFMKRTLNPNTLVYDFVDGSSPITAEQREKILQVNEMLSTSLAFILKDAYVEQNKKLTTLPPPPMEQPKTYQAQGECTNCGRENFPQWGEYETGKFIQDYPCPNCECMTWVPRKKIFKDLDLGKTGVCKSNL